MKNILLFLACVLSACSGGGGSSPALPSNTQFSTTPLAAATIGIKTPAPLPTPTLQPTIIASQTPIPSITPTITVTTTPTPIPTSTIKPIIPTNTPTPIIVVSTNSPTSQPIIPTPIPTSQITSTFTPPPPYTPNSTLPLSIIKNKKDVITFETDIQFQLGPSNGVYAVQSFDQSVIVPNWLYAPTLKGYNDCIEITTNMSTGTSAQVVIADFCSLPPNGSGTQVTYPVTISTNTMIANYTRNLGKGRLEYVAESYRDGNGTWYALLYNFTNSKWDTIYSTINDLYNEETYWGYGWDAWETHYALGAYCAPITNISSRQLQTMSQQLQWGPANTIQKNWPLPNGVTSCFTNNGPYYFYFLSSTEWIASSSKQNGILVIQ